MYLPVGLSPTERAELLEKTPLFADIHANAANTGQSAIPPNLDTDFHFTCFVQAPSIEAGKEKGEGGHRLIELDGRRAGPIDRGQSEDLLKVSVLTSHVWPSYTEPKSEGRRGICERTIRVRV